METIEAGERSIMATGAMLWGGASYNNGILPYKNYILGEAYTREGDAAKLVTPGDPPGQQPRTGSARGSCRALSFANLASYSPLVMYFVYLKGAVGQSTRSSLKLVYPIQLAKFSV